MNSSRENVLPNVDDIAAEADPPRNTKHDDRKPSLIASIGWPRCVFLGVVVLFLFALGYSTIFRVAWHTIERTDYTVYSLAGQAVLDHTNIYEVQNSRGWNYVYPPPFAILMTPFAKLSLAWGSALWYLISLSGLVSATVMSVRLAREAIPLPGGKNDLWTLYEVPVFLASPWLMSGLMRCQASEFMIWLMIAAVYFCWRGRHFLGGMTLAAATLMKAFPVALLGYFVLRRQWRFVGAFFLCMVLGGLILPATVYGWQKNLDYWRQWVAVVGGPSLAANNARQNNPLYAQLLDAQKPRNQSLESLFLSLKAPPEKAMTLLAIVSLGMLAAMALMARKSDSKTQLLVVSAFVTWNLLIPPISESHYFGLMLLPLAVLTSAALGGADRLSRRLAMWVLILVFVATLWGNLDKSIQLYRPLCWSSLGVWLCLLALIYRRNGIGTYAYLAG